MFNLAAKDLNKTAKPHQVHKMLAKRYLNQGKETEEQFSVRVKECVHLFQEAQASNILMQTWFKKVFLSEVRSGSGEEGPKRHLEISDRPEKRPKRSPIGTTRPMCCVNNSRSSLFGEF